MKITYKKLSLLILLAAASILLILAVLPRADKLDISYELNQPWHYPLLTAQFDMPILRDSVSAKAMRDSIDKAFVPFVRRDHDIADKNVEEFSKAISAIATPHEQRVLTSSLEKVYARGILDTEIYNTVKSQGTGQLRTAYNNKAENQMSNIDAGAMMTQKMAYLFIDSVYRSLSPDGSLKMSPEMSRAVSRHLVDNIVVDTVHDLKYRNMEYLNVNGALGIIKQGQRIVDRGEIITPQIFTNLNTYTKMKAQMSKDNDDIRYYFIGQAAYVVLCYVLLYVYLHLYRNRFFTNYRSMIFLVSLITLFVVFAILMFENLNNGLYLVPFATIPILVSIFFDSRTAVFSLLTAVLLTAVIALYPFQFIFIELSTGLVALFCVTQLSKRSQLLLAAFLTFVSYNVGFLVMSLMQDGDLLLFNWRLELFFAINCIALSFCYVLVVLIERIFGFTSAVTLVELSDINNKLLRQLSEEAPGTFQHSMQVSMLASEAARAVGANVQLVRTGALYHDIGKLESPIFFTENQHGINPHAGLDPETSARKIISHVTNGLKKAREAKLPKVVKAFISEHHGKGLAKYFYNTACNANPGQEIDKEPFTYPGPNPQSRETAILMMADAVEAASRSLDDFSTQSISNLVDKIVDSQVRDGLFKDSPISFRDLETIKETFKKRLGTIYHSRIAYPELKRQ